jgi:hypothetical protein
MKTVAVAIILALSLSTGGLTAAAGYLPSESMQSSASGSGIQTRPTQSSYANGTMTVAGVTPGGLQSAIEAVLAFSAGQTAGNFDYSVITKLVLTTNSSLNAADQSFISENLTQLTSLDLSGHIATFAIDFQNIRTLTEVRLPADAVLTETMFSGCDRLVRVMFTGTTAPEISSNAFSGVTAVAFVPNTGTGGYENSEFTGRFSNVIATAIPTFTAQPQNQSAIVGQDVVFSVTVTGAPNPTLQWQVSTDNGQTWTNIDGQTGNTLRLNAVNLTQGGNQYRCIAENLAAEVISNIVTLNVNEISNAQTPSITNQPESTSTIPNGNVTLSVTAQVSDNGNLSYQWFSNTTDRNTGGTLIQGATGRTYTPPTTAEGTMFYYVVITNTNNNVNGTVTASVTSNTARVIVNRLVNAQTPEIINQPMGVNIMLDGRTSLTVIARVADNGTLSYQWFRNDTASTTGGTPVRGATGQVLELTNDTVGITYYYVVITNTNNNANGTKTATITSEVVPVTVFTVPDAPQNIIAIVDGEQVVLSWDAPDNDGNSDIIGYQVSDDIVTLWIEANGDYEHTFSGLGYDREYTFKVRAVNAAGYSEEAVITVTTDEREIISVTGVYLDKETLTLYIGEFAILTASVQPEDADNQSVTWSSSDSTIAKVDENGVVTALATGTATITVTTKDGQHTASCEVTVEHHGISNPLLWIGLGTLAPLGTGTGIYFWRKNRNSAKHLTHGK